MSQRKIENEKAIEKHYAVKKSNPNDLSYRYYMWGKVSALQLEKNWSNHRIALHLGVSLKFLRWCEGLAGTIHDEEIILSATEREKIENILSI